MDDKLLKEIEHSLARLEAWGRLALVPRDKQNLEGLRPVLDKMDLEIVKSIRDTLIADSSGATQQPERFRRTANKVLQEVFEPYLAERESRTVPDQHKGRWKKGHKVFGDFLKYHKENYPNDNKDVKTERLIEFLNKQPIAAVDDLHYWAANVARYAAEDGKLHDVELALAVHAAVCPYLTERKEHSSTVN